MQTHHKTTQGNAAPPSGGMWPRLHALCVCNVATQYSSDQHTVGALCGMRGHHL